MSDTLSILQVSTFDRWGGAEAVASGLTRGMQSEGHEAHLAVGWERGGGQVDVVELPREGTANLWAKALRAGAGVLGAHRRSPLVDRVASPGRMLDWWAGRESNRFPSTKHLMDAVHPRPDVLHLHNLHGNYFDLRELPRLSRTVPTVFTMHDAWLTTGHCAHPIGCDRWKTGCGQCPDLSIYPPLRRDGTSGNWRRKQAIYAASRLYVATPCQWLMDQVEQSMLMPGILESRVIPNSVDLQVFKPGDPQAARQELGLPTGKKILLFAAAGRRDNPFKDAATLERALADLDEHTGRDLLLIMLGDDGPTEHLGSAELRRVPFQSDPVRVAAYYQAADIYVHAAKADTFPNVVLEALACGTPVIASAVGGVPEQVKPLDGFGTSVGATHAANATGLLVPTGDASAFSAAIKLLSSDDGLCRQLGANASQDAATRFSSQAQVHAYLDWYRELVEMHPAQAGHRRAGS